MPVEVLNAGEKYQVLEELSQGPYYTLYSGCERQTREKVILKYYTTEALPLSEMEAIKEMHARLGNTCQDCIARTIDTLGAGASSEELPGIVYDGSAGITIESFLHTRRLAMKEFLEVAIRIAACINDFHASGITRRGLCSRFIFINPESLSIKFHDYGFPTAIDCCDLYGRQAIESILPYISPEQTGRMNREVDYRSDLYSLGIILYEMLVGASPFISQDPAEIIHAHLARKPLPPARLVESTPSVISNIILTLLEKNPEDRYQSAWGVRRDLEYAKELLSPEETIGSFPLKEYDAGEQLYIPGRIYGRRSEIKNLLNGLEAVLQGQTMVVMIRGYSGVGKSSLVGAVRPLVQAAGGVFLSGKFDQYHKNIPYSAIIQAFSKMAEIILGEDTTTIKEWKVSLLKALGANSRVITDVVPEMALITGIQPPVTELPPQEAQNRFHLLFTQFISVFANRGHPMVLFLDDLQWADPSSLKLIESIIGSGETPYLYLIGAYRSNEVDTEHPLAVMIKSMTGQDMPLTEITLGPLGSDHVEQIIADTLGGHGRDIGALSRSVFDKTRGNPLFTVQFLRSVHAEGMLTYDYRSGSWIWDIDLIRSKGGTENVVALLSDKIKKLPSPVRETLEHAACFGSRFDLPMLCAVAGILPQSAAQDLLVAEDEGLIVSVGQSRRNLKDLTATPGKVEAGQYRVMNIQGEFVHDGIRQAVYSQIPESRRKEIHHTIGVYLKKSYPDFACTEKIFDVVSHLNLCSDMTEGSEGKDSPAGLNLAAGRRAKASSAYGPALQYLNAGLAFLEDDCWNRSYETALGLHTEGAEAAFLTGDYDLMDRLADGVLVNTVSLLDKAGVFEVKIMALMAQNKPRESVYMALDVLELFGISFPRRPNKAHFMMELIRIRGIMAVRGRHKILDLKGMSDLRMLAVMRILTKIFPAVFITVPLLYPLVVFKQIELSLRFGNAAETAYAYAVYGLILCGLPGMLCDIEEGYRFGNLALNLLDRLHTDKYRANTLFIFNCFIRHWKDHASRTLNPFMKGYSAGLEAGDLETAGFCMFLHDYYSYACGTNLMMLERDMAKSHQVIAQLKQKTTLNWHKMLMQTVMNLSGRSEDPCILKGEAYDEDEMLTVHRQAGDRTAIGNLYYNKAFLCFVFNRHEQAIGNFRLLDGYLDALTSTLGVSLSCFYDSLSLLSVYPIRPAADKKRIMKRVDLNRERILKWARHAPMNYLHRHHLVEAMRLACLGQTRKAGEHFRKAVELSAENGYHQERAYACELAGRFCLSAGQDEEAKKYLRQALHGYDEWGASAKVQRLREEFNAILPVPKVKNHPRSSLSRLDYTSVVHSLQAISTEIVLDELLKKLLNIVAENAGADRAVFISLDGEEMTVAAEKGPEPDSEVAVSESPLAGRADLLIPAINYVRQTGRHLVLDDAAGQGQFTSDAYVLHAGSKSILCMPVVRQSDPIAILYLENTLVTHAFTKDRIEVLRLLASQAAISLENARLYERMNRLLEMQRIFSSISSSFINLPLDEIPREIDNTLEVLGNYVKEDRCYLFLMSRDGVFVDETNEWCAPGIRPNLEKFRKLQMNDFPWVREKLENFEIIHVPRVEDLPPESGSLKELLKKRSIQSFVAIPMMHGGRLIGFIGFEAVRQEKTWDENYITLLRTVAEILANACARKRAEEDLKDYQEKLRSLSSELVLAEEKERRRIATDVHDRVGHALAAAGMKMRLLQEKASSPDTTEAIHVVRDLIDQLITDTQTLTFVLSPPVLYDLGLEAAVDWLVEETRNRHGLDISFSSDIEGRFIDITTRVLVFQAIRELLFNIVKHAHARNAKVMITCRDEELCTEIEDDGCGFETMGTSSHGGKRGGFGLFSIRERLSSLGGNLSLESGPGKGTRITMRTPMTSGKKHEGEH